MYAWGDEDLSQEEVEKIIEDMATRIHAYGMGPAAIIALETVKPLSNLGTELSRMFFSPFLPIIGPEYNLLGDKLLFVFKDRENIEKLIKNLESKAEADIEKKKEAKQKKKQEKHESSETESEEEES